jgi:hypothetical protein
MYPIAMNTRRRAQRESAEEGGFVLDDSVNDTPANSSAAMNSPRDGDNGANNVATGDNNMSNHALAIDMKDVQLLDPSEGRENRRNRNMNSDSIKREGNHNQRNNKRPGGGGQCGGGANNAVDANNTDMVSVRGISEKGTSDGPINNSSAAIDSNVQSGNSEQNRSQHRSPVECTAGINPARKSSKSMSLRSSKSSKSVSTVGSSGGNGSSSCTLSSPSTDIVSSLYPSEVAENEANGGPHVSHSDGREGAHNECDSGSNAGEIDCVYPSNNTSSESGRKRSHSSHNVVPSGSHHNVQITVNGDPSAYNHSGNSTQKASGNTTNKPKKPPTPIEVAQRLGTTMKNTVGTVKNTVGAASGMIAAGRIGGHIGKNIGRNSGVHGRKTGGYSAQQNLNPGYNSGQQNLNPLTSAYRPTTPYDYQAFDDSMNLSPSVLSPAVSPAEGLSPAMLSPAALSQSLSNTVTDNAGGGLAGKNKTPEEIIDPSQKSENSKNVTGNNIVHSDTINSSPDVAPHIVVGKSRSGSRDNSNNNSAMKSGNKSSGKRNERSSPEGTNHGESISVRSCSVEIMDEVLSSPPTSQESGSRAA